MNRLGIQSLNAGAPDLRLTGDHRPTYTQRRRTQMAGGGITNARPRQGYFLGGVGDFFGGVKDKIVDDLIPNELKSPVGAALAGGALLNQFGIPFTGTAGNRMGQNWLGDLLGQDLVYGAGGAQPVSLEDYQMIPGPITTGAGTGEMIFGKMPEHLGLPSLTLPSSDADKSLIEQAGGWVKDKVTGAIRNVLTGQTSTGADTTTGTGQDISWKIPLAVGAAAHEYQKKYLEDQPPFPMDETGIKFQTAQEAMADPNLRFKPEAQYANVAEGGRIGFDDGGPTPSMDEIARAFKLEFGYDMSLATDKVRANFIQDYTTTGTGKAQGGRIGYRFGEGVESIPTDQMQGIEGQQAGGEYDRVMELLLKIRENTPLTDEEKEELQGLMQTLLLAKGGRVAAQEGGLMNLGGMEKDYRQEGGFVPIGGQEKADDVPARLSKNEFVFTADAVRAAGGGDIDAGAEVMENLMENLEAGGEVSEDSQGLEGARNMFANAQQLEKRII